MLGRRSSSLGESLLRRRRGIRDTQSVAMATTESSSRVKQHSLGSQSNADGKPEHRVDLRAHMSIDACQWTIGNAWRCTTAAPFVPMWTAFQSRSFLFQNRSPRSADSVRRNVSTSTSAGGGGSRTSKSVDVIAAATASKKEVEEMESLLSKACLQARDISALAKRPTAATQSPTMSEAKCISSPTAIPQSKNVQEALSASDALLSLTSHPSFQRALFNPYSSPTSDTEAGDSKKRSATLCLHGAFISVLSWLCSVLNSYPLPEMLIEDSFHPYDMSRTISSPTQSLNSTQQQELQSRAHQEALLLKIQSLTARSTNLNLSLHIPLYQTIACCIAKYSNAALSETAPLLLDLSSQMSQTLSYGATDRDSHDIVKSIDELIATPSFFTEPLKILILRRKVRDVVGVLRRMSFTHNGIKREWIDLKLGSELLFTLEHQARVLADTANVKTKRTRSRKTARSKYSADVIELAQLLEAPVMKAIRALREKEEWYAASRNWDRTAGTSSIGQEEHDSDDSFCDEMDSADSIQNDYDSDIDMDEIDDDIFNDEESSQKFAERFLKHEITDVDREEKIESEDHVIVNDSDEVNMDALNTMVDSIVRGEADEKMKKSAKVAAVEAIRALRRKFVADKEKKEAARNKWKHGKRQSLETEMHDDSYEDDTHRGDKAGAEAIIARLLVNNTTGNIEDIDICRSRRNEIQQQSLRRREHDVEEQMHQSMVKDIVYLRSLDQDYIPDVVEQLQEWNRGNDVLLTREYEEALIRQEVEEDVNHFHDNDEYDDDDHDDDDDDDHDDDDGGVYDNFENDSVDDYDDSGDDYDDYDGS